MVAALGFATIACFLALAFSRRVSVLVALILVPIAFAIVGGWAPDLGE
ncbi:MAG: citrate transporter, partial [Steroidobacteraceae bacterium]